MKLLPALALLLSIPAEIPFEPWFSERGVAVEIARQGGGTPWVRGTAELPVSARRVAAVLLDYEHYRDIFAPALRTARVLDREGSTVRIHMVWPYPFPYRNRDAVVGYRWEERADGGLLLAWGADARDGDPKSGVRIERVAREARIEPLGPERSRVTYTYLGDLGGRFPAGAMEKAWRAEPVHYVRALRRRLRIPDP